MNVIIGAEQIVMQYRRTLALTASVLVITAFVIFQVAPRLVDLWHGWIFLTAFDRAVAAMGKDGSVAGVGGPIDAARACKSPGAMRLVDERCLDAFRKDKRQEKAEVIIAYYVWTETRESLSNDTMDALRKLAADPETNNWYLSGDLDALIAHFERRLAIVPEGISRENKELRLNPAPH